MIPSSNAGAGVPSGRASWCQEKCKGVIGGGLRLLCVGKVLRVNPDRLRAAAREQTDVGEFFSGMGVGQSMTGAGEGVSGLLSEGACQLAGSIVDTAVGNVHEELTTHASNLSTAADHYHRTDEELGRRLRRFAP